MAVLEISKFMIMQNKNKIWKSCIIQEVKHALTGILIVVHIVRETLDLHVSLIAYMEQRVQIACIATQIVDLVGDMIMMNVTLVILVGHLIILTLVFLLVEMVIKMMLKIVKMEIQSQVMVVMLHVLLRLAILVLEGILLQQILV